MRPVFFLISFAIICFVLFFGGLIALRLTIGFLVFGKPAKYCDVAHNTFSYPIPSPKTAMDYFENGNYEYDRGNCMMAIADYTQSIRISPNYAEAYDNRAYTYMTEENYATALPDLDKAIALRPDYVHALMNRGDIYNYYYNVDHQKALEDYNRVLAMGPSVYRSTAVCGHSFLAKENGWSLKTFFDMLTQLPMFHRGNCN